MQGWFSPISVSIVERYIQFTTSATEIFTHLESFSYSGNIKSLGPNENVSFKVLSLMLVTLLGLTAPDRSSNLAKRDLRFRTFHPEGVSFSLSGISKTSSPGDLVKTSFHAAFKEDKDLCPVECLKCYELRTKEFRSFTNGVNKQTNGVIQQFFRRTL